MVPKFLKVLDKEGYPLLISIPRIISMSEYEVKGKHFVDMKVAGVDSDLDFELDTTIKAIQLQLDELEVGVRVDV